MRGQYPRDKCIHQLFAEQVARTPDAIAAVFEGVSLTYGELNRRANCLACNLWHELGVGREIRVAVHLDRSLEYVVGVLRVFSRLAVCTYPWLSTTPWTGGGSCLKTVVRRLSSPRPHCRRRCSKPNLTVLDLPSVGGVSRSVCRR